MKNKIRSIAYRRKREGRTDYKKRLKLLLSNKPRLVIRKTNRNIIAQLIDYSPDGDIILASGNSQELTKLGWKAGRTNLPSAYLTGMLIAKKALAKKHKEAILDLGLQASTKGSKIYACLKGAIEGGLSIPCDPEILPSDERIKGTHIAHYSKEAKKNQSGKQFSLYEKNKVDAEQLPEYFEKLKEKISHETKK
jgi:large subunit ribosomal protein L18